MSLLRSEEQARHDQVSSATGALRGFPDESFHRFQLAGLGLICLKNKTKADAERDLRNLISAVGTDEAVKAGRGLLRHLKSADKAHPLELAKYGFGARWPSYSEMDLKQ